MYLILVRSNDSGVASAVKTMRAGLANAIIIGSPIIIQKMLIKETRSKPVVILLSRSLRHAASFDESVTVRMGSEKRTLAAKLSSTGVLSRTSLRK